MSQPASPTISPRKPKKAKSGKGVFIFATEGERTEPEYLRELKQHLGVQVMIATVQPKGSQPAKALERMQNFLASRAAKIGNSAYHAWIVVDKDDIPDNELQKVHDWAQVAENRGLALSNPCFEYWLLLHFADATPGLKRGRYMALLKQHLPGYDKSINKAQGRMLCDKVHEAVCRAKQKDDPPCADWPRETGSTMYRLVEKMLP